MLVGTRSGLVLLPRRRQPRLSRSRTGSPPTTCSPSSRTRPACGSVPRHGLARWERGAIRPVDVPELQDVYVSSLTVDSAVDLWAGLQSGGVTGLGRPLRARRWARAGSHRPVGLGRRRRTRQGRIWMATNGDGVFVADGDSIRQITTRDGLANDFVWAVLPDSRGDVWLFSSNGLDRYSAGSVRHYGAGDGVVDLEGSATAALEDTHGLLWFGPQHRRLPLRPLPRRTRRRRTARRLRGRAERRHAPVPAHRRGAAASPGCRDDAFLVAHLPRRAGRALPLPPRQRRRRVVRAGRGGDGEPRGTGAGVVHLRGGRGEPERRRQRRAGARAFHGAPHLLANDLVPRPLGAPRHGGPGRCALPAGPEPRA